MSDNNLKNEKELLDEAADTVEAADTAEAASAAEAAETAEAASVAAPEPEKQPEAPKKTAGLRSDKFKRGGMATLMSVVFVAIIVVLNLLVGLLQDRFPSLNIDLTAQHLNTLSDQAAEIARGVSNDTTIYLVGQEDNYRKDKLYSSYGIQYSQVANLADRLRETNSKIHVEFIDPDLNPTFISSHSEDTLTSGCLVVETEKRHKAVYPDDLFSITTNRTTGAAEIYSKADSALAAALEFVNMEDVPLLTLATGHNEILTSDNLGSFLDAMEAQNFEVREINILTDEIPAETQILMIATPTTDYTVEEIAKLQAYMNDDARAEDLTLLVTCHPTQGTLPNLAGFLEEWGVRVEEGGIMETDQSRMASGSPTYVMVNAQQDEILAGNTYNYLVAASCSPLTVLFSGNGDVATNVLWKTNDTAFVLTEDMDAIPDDPDTSEQVAAALGAKFVMKDNVNYRHTVVVFGSSAIFTSSFINASAYGDRQYLTDLMQFCTGTDASVVRVNTQQVQTNVVDISAPVSLVNVLGIGVFTVGLPLVILIAGLVIFLKRRHL
mgnify:CR=1 FL=1